MKLKSFFNSKKLESLVVLKYSSEKHLLPIKVILAKEESNLKIDLKKQKWYLLGCNQNGILGEKREIISKKEDEIIAVYDLKNKDHQDKMLSNIVEMSRKDVYDEDYEDY